MWHEEKIRITFSCKKQFPNTTKSSPLAYSMQDRWIRHNRLSGWNYKEINHPKGTNILTLWQKSIENQRLWPIKLDKILRHDNERTSHFTALGGKIYFWVLWYKWNDIWMEGSPGSFLPMMQPVRSKVISNTPISLSFDNKDMDI